MEPLGTLSSPQHRLYDILYGRGPFQTAFGADGPDVEANLAPEVPFEAELGLIGLGRNGTLCFVREPGNIRIELQQTAK